MSTQEIKILSGSDKIIIVLVRLPAIRDKLLIIYTIYIYGVYILQEI